MYNKIKFLAVIPARGGSKGIPKKNIKTFAGRPLIAYTIRAAKISKYIDKVIVSTDSKEIASISRQWGADVPFLRPDFLAEDTSRTIDCIVHAKNEMEKMGESYDAVVTLQPTSPLRRSEEIDRSIEEYVSHGQLGLASVSEASENPILTRRIDDSGVMHPILSMGSTVRRQEMPKFWHVDGAIYINETRTLNCNTSLNDNPIAFVMPPHRSCDIDTLSDFIDAEKTMLELDGASFPWK